MHTPPLDGELATVILGASATQLRRLTEAQARVDELENEREGLVRQLAATIELAHDAGDLRRDLAAARADVAMAVEEANRWKAIVAMLVARHPDAAWAQGGQMVSVVRYPIDEQMGMLLDENQVVIEHDSEAGNVVVTLTRRPLL